MSSQSNRRIRRYSLRMMFALITVFACWFGIQVKWKTDRADAISWMRDQAVFWEDLPVDQGPQLEGNAPLTLRLLGAPGLKAACVIIADKSAVLDKQRELDELFPEADILVGSPRTGYKGKHTALVKH